MIDNMLERYKATMVLHAMGDTIGFKNGEWEFKFQNAKGVPNDEPREYKIRRFENIPIEKLYEFIYLGGVKQVPQKGWYVSDDTILHMAVAECLLSEYNSLNTLANKLVQKLISSMSVLLDSKKNRFPGATTMDSIRKLKSGKRWDELPYDYYSGGSGASMRSLCIGLAYYGKDKRDMLIQTSIELSRITHNSATGYLGGLASAFFVALAIEGVGVEKWGKVFLDLLKSDSIGKYIKTAGRDVDKYERDAHIFISKWSGYIEDKFDGDKVRIRRSDMNLVYRTRYYHDNFAFQKDKNYFIGSGGDDSVIIAYDCLLDAGNSWEKLVVYSMLHAGDTDTTGAIAGGLWGALYGFADVPSGILEHLEYRSKLEQLGEKLANKFNL